MSEWNFDLTTIPRGRTEERTRTVKTKDGLTESPYEVYVPEPIWVETIGGSVVRSHFCPPTRTSPNGWWNGVGPESNILCWQPYIVPEPSRRTPRADAGSNIVTRHSEINLPIIEDVGSGA